MEHTKEAAKRQFSWSSLVFWVGLALLFLAFELGQRSVTSEYETYERQKELME